MSWFDQFGPVIGGQASTIGRTLQGGQLPNSINDAGLAGYTTPPTQPRIQPTATAGQDPRAFFQSLFPGGTLTPQQLASKEAELKAQGIRLLGPNAAGMRTKIELPNGQIVDVIGGAGAGRNRNQWMVDSGGNRPAINRNPFVGGPNSGKPGTLGAGMNYGARLGALQDTPGYQFRFDQGMKALEGSAAAKGTLLTGGASKDAMEFGQGLASTEFDNEYRRLFGMAELGGRAADSIGGYGSSYGSNATDLITGGGNARANAALTSGNAWAGATTNLGALGGGVMSRWPTQQAPNGYGYPPNPYNPYGTPMGYTPQPGTW